MLSLLVVLLLNQLIPFFLQLFALLSCQQSSPAFLVVGIQTHAFGEEFLSSATVSSIQLDDAFEVPEIWALLVEADSNGLGEGESLSGISCFGQALDLIFFEFFAVGDFAGEVIHTRQCFSIIVLLSSNEVTIVVGLHMFSIL